ncbi:hypothetical protein FHT15_001025 [Xanthomonas campestris]
MQVAEPVAAVDLRGHRQRDRDRVRVRVRVHAAQRGS